MSPAGTAIGILRIGQIQYFAVPYIAAVHEKLKAQGVKFADEPHMIARMPDHDLFFVTARAT